MQFLDKPNGNGAAAQADAQPANGLPQAYTDDGSDVPCCSRHRFLPAGPALCASAHFLLPADVPRALSADLPIRVLATVE